MNPITFNDPLMPAIATKYSPRERHELGASPLFVHEVSFDSAADYMRSNNQRMRESGEDAEFSMPYPMLRASITAQFTHERVSFRFFARHTENGTGDLWCWSPLRASERRHNAESLVSLTSVLLDVDVSRHKVNFQYYSNMKRRWIREDDLNSGLTIVGSKGAIYPDVDKGLSMSAYQAYCVFMGFIRDVMAPTNHIVEVTPAPGGVARSVEWTKARTHYTLITHEHPANNVAVSKGARVKADATKELQRMAHGRRAHFKTLRHERYKYARGKRIFVRATWVGPKEWQDEGGRQIYRILDPVDPCPAQSTNGG